MVLFYIHSKDKLNKSRIPTGFPPILEDNRCGLVDRNGFSCIDLGFLG